MENLTQEDLLVIYLALSTQIEDCMGIMNEESNESLAHEASIIFEKSNIILDKIQSMMDIDKPIERPKWTM